MNAEIIAVGSELLTPHRQDSNSLFLTEKLNQLGVEVVFKTIVGDRRAHIEGAVKLALERADLVITMGGLGRPQGLAFDAEGNLYVAASLAGRRGIVKITPDRQASLAVAGHGLIGMAFTRSRSAILATTNAVHHLAWDVAGRPLLD